MASNSLRYASLSLPRQRQARREVSLSAHEKARLRVSRMARCACADAFIRLRWIKAGPLKMVQQETNGGTMMRFTKGRLMFGTAPASRPAPAANLAVMADKLDIATVPAVWPTGILQLAQAIDICQRCDASEVCGDWLARAPKHVAQPPQFCPNAGVLRQAKKRD
jgi:hypothetical protein